MTEEGNDEPFDQELPSLRLPSPSFGTWRDMAGRALRLEDSLPSQSVPSPKRALTKLALNNLQDLAGVGGTKAGLGRAIPRGLGIVRNPSTGISPKGVRHQLP